MAVSVKSIAIGVVVLVLIILIIRWIMGDSTKLSGLTDAKKSYQNLCPRFSTK